MTYAKSILITSSLLFLSACSSSEVPVKEGGYYHSDIYFGSHFPDIYKKGIQDGCTTAKGNYKKSHQLFQNKKDYVDGWFLGRNKCRYELLTKKD